MNPKTFDKRTVKRIKMVLGLRLRQLQPQAPDLLVHTLDLNSSGAKIGALREWIEPDSLVVVHRGHTRVRCRVVWSRQVGPREVQIGIEFPKQDARLWGLDLDEDCAGVRVATRCDDPGQGVYNGDS
jgi:hypothetical protein